MPDDTILLFDQWQRYGNAAKLVDALRRPGETFRILEVGAHTHRLLARFLPFDALTGLDIVPAGPAWPADSFLQKDICASGLADASFDLVLCLDVLEHIPAPNRSLALREMCRIAATGLILCAPFADPAVLETERFVDDHCLGVTGERQSWLSEHAACGLPDMEESRQVLAGMFPAVACAAHGNLDIWSKMMRAHLDVFAAGSRPEALRQLHGFYIADVGPADWQPPCYRHFLTAVRGRPAPRLEMPDAGGLSTGERLKGFLAAFDRCWTERIGAERVQHLINRAEEARELVAATRDRLDRIEDRLDSLDHRLTRLHEVAETTVHEGRDRLHFLRCMNHEIVSRTWTWRLKRLLAATLGTDSAAGLKRIRDRAREVGWRRTLSRGWRRLLAGGPKAVASQVSAAGHSSPDWTLTPARTPTSMSRLLEELRGLPARPLLSIVMPVYNVDPDVLHETIMSVRAQVYDTWEICIADDRSDSPETRSYLESLREERIQVRFLEERQNISGASNEAASLAKGDFLVFLDNDDLLTRDALLELAKAQALFPDADLLYSDEDKLSVDGRFTEPHFKPAWSPETFLSLMYTSHLMAVRRSCFEACGGFRRGYEGSQDYDLVLRVTEQTDRVVHIPRILYHWRVIPGSTADRYDAKPQARETSLKALRDALVRRGLGDSVQPGLIPNAFRPVIRIREPALISIIIPTKDKTDVLDRALRSIRSKTTWPHYEILVVDNQSTEPVSRDYLARIAREPGTRVLSYDRPFNFSALNNWAATQAAGKLLLFLNNDVEVITPDWLEQMAMYLEIPGVGAVGAKLYYPDDRIQHAGVILGVGGLAGHSHKYFPRAAEGYFGRLRYAQNVSAVTGACLLCRMEAFEAVGGFDERLAVAFNDVDLCLNICKNKWRIVWTPFAELLHYESVSRGPEDNPKKVMRFNSEVQYCRKKWGCAVIENDPHYNLNFSLDREDFYFLASTLAPRPRTRLSFFESTVY